MMPLSHIYVSAGVSGREDPLLVFGSVLPDIATTSKGKIPRERIHDSPLLFYAFVKDGYPRLSDLAVGVKLHGSVLKGADYYSDDPESGFAVKEGRKILKLVQEMLASDDEEKSLTAAHNFIEAGVELNLVKNMPRLLKVYSESINSVDKDEIAQCIGEFIGADKNMIYEEVVRFDNSLGSGNIDSLEDIVKDIIVPMTWVRFGKAVKTEEALLILKKSVEITADKAIGYLDEAVQGMKRNLELAG